MVNRQIVVSVLILMSAGAYRVLVVHPDPKTRPGVTLTRVLIGGYVLAIIASIVDLVSGVGSQIAGLLLGLAVTSALLAVLPDLVSRLAGGGAAASAASSGGGSGHTYR